MRRSRPERHHSPPLTASARHLCHTPAVLATTVHTLHTRALRCTSCSISTVIDAAALSAAVFDVLLHHSLLGSTCRLRARRGASAVLPEAAQSADNTTLPRCCWWKTAALRDCDSESVKLRVRGVRSQGEGGGHIGVSAETSDDETGEMMGEWSHSQLRPLTPPPLLLPSSSPLCSPSLHLLLPPSAPALRTLPSASL